MASKKISETKVLAVLEQLKSLCSELETSGRISNGITVLWHNDAGLTLNIPPKVVQTNDFGKVLGTIGGMGRTKTGKYMLLGSGFDLGNGKSLLLKLEAVVPNKARVEKQVEESEEDFVV